MSGNTDRKLYTFDSARRKDFEMLKIPLGIYQYVNGRSNVLLISDGLCELVGRERSDLMSGLNESMFRNVHPDDAPRIAQIGERFACHESPDYDVIYHVRVKDGSWHIFHTIGNWQVMEDGTQLAFLYYTDMSQSTDQIKKLSEGFEDQMKSRVYRDELTGLPNLNYFYEFAQEFCAASRQNREEPVLVQFCLGQLNDYNALYGFKEGDRLLQNTADILQEIFDGTLIARGQGKHFFVICGRDHVEEKVRRASERIREAALGGCLQLQVGLCGFDKTDDLSVVLDHSTAALRSIGTNTQQVFAWYDGTLEEKARGRSYVLDNFGRALKNRWIRVWYQAQVRSDSGKICGYEALARWQDPKHGMISPGVFVPVLEEYHRIRELDRYMLEEVCYQMQQFRQQGCRVVPVSVNFCAEDLEQEGSLPAFLEILEKYGCTPKDIVIEITERESVGSSGLFKENMKRFRDAGFQVWVDDFGSGYSALNVLQSYSFDLIKLDRPFVRDLDENGGANRKIIEGIVRVAKALGIHTLAEGVETKEQAAFLAGAGCEMMQGFLFHKPEPFDDAASLPPADAMEDVQHS